MNDQTPNSAQNRSRIEQDFQAAASLHGQGRLREAEQLYQAVLRVDGAHAAALHNLGLIRLHEGETHLAVRLFLDSLHQNPTSSQAHFSLGAALQSLDRHEEAIAHYTKVLTIRPNVAQVHYNMGILLQKLDRHEEAIVHYTKALTIRPDVAQAQYNLGNSLKALGRHKEAIVHYERAIASKPDLAQAHNNLANSLATLNRSDEAIAHYMKALAIQPDLAQAHNNLGMEFELQGRLDEARDAYEKAVEFAPKNAPFYRNLANVKQFTSGDRQIAAMDRLADDMALLSWHAQVDLHFAIGKAFADIGEHERSFRHVLAGNNLKRQQINYDEVASLKLFDRIVSVFTPALMRSKAGLGAPSVLPVFIVGMPRSGSSLVEQVLASHPKIFGAGEITDFRSVVDKVSRPTNSDALFPEIVASLTADQLHQIGTDYLSRIAVAAPAVERITDKLPDNFLLAGLIHLALPNARIIHTRRDPVDTCFSYFSKLFTGTKPYTNDLGELGRYYRAYANLMDHWRRVLPEGVMLEVSYEDVIRDLEGQARRLVAHCGLAWDDACLTFHKTQRAVRSGSAAQVRRPIYATSVGRSRQYKDLLVPLLDALGVVTNSQ